MSEYREHVVVGHADLLLVCNGHFGHPEGIDIVGWDGNINFDDPLDVNLPLGADAHQIRALAESLLDIAAHIEQRGIDTIGDIMRY